MLDPDSSSTSTSPKYHTFPLSHLRSPFFPRTSSELAFLSQYLEDKISLASSISSEVERICAELVEVNQEDTQGIHQYILLQRKLTQHDCTLFYLRRQHRIARALLSPIRRLPTELLIEIFSFCVEPVIRFDHWGPLGRGVRTTQLLTISQVCFRWRDIAQSTPTLWASSEWCVDLNAVTMRRPGCLGILRHYVSMSRSAGLAVNLKAWTLGGEVVVDPGFMNKPSEEVLEMMLGCSARWRCAKLEVRDERTWGDVLRQLHSASTEYRSEGYFPNLKTLELVDCWGPPSGLFAVALRLTEIRLERVGGVDVSVFPCEQLRTLRVSSDHLVSLSQHQPHLYSLDLLELTWIRSPPLANTLIVLPSLTTLLLTISSEVHTSCPFQSLTLPHLRTLHLRVPPCSHISSSYPFPSSAFLSFLTRSTPPLSELRITGYVRVSSPTALLRTFRLLSHTLASLSIDDIQRGRYRGCKLSHAIVPLLLIRGGMKREEVVLPRLRELDVKMVLAWEKSNCDKSNGGVEKRKGTGVEVGKEVIREMIDSRRVPRVEGVEVIERISVITCLK